MNAYRESLRLAWPLIFSNISVPLLGMVDTGVVGHLPEASALAGVALGSTLISVAYFVLGFLRMGTTGLTAQAFGAGNGREIKAGLIRAVLVGGGLGLLLMTFTPLLVGLGHEIFAPPPDVAMQFERYVAFRLLGAPAALANICLLGWMLGMQNSRGPLILLVATNLFNAILDIILVMGFGQGAGGVALASAIADYGGLALALWLVAPIWRRYSDETVKRATILDPAAIRRLFSVNADLFVRSLMLEAAFLSFTALGARQGPDILAANAVLFHFFSFAAYGLDGFAFATEAMVGRAVGARDVAFLRAASRAGFVNAAILAIGLSCVFWLGTPLLIDILTTLPDIRMIARDYAVYVALVPLVAVWAFLFDGIFIGATRTAELRNAMIVAAAGFAALVALLMPPLGNHGLWLALLGFLGSRGLLLGAIYWRADRGAAFARG